MHVQVRDALADLVVDRHERALRPERGLHRRGDPLHALEVGAEPIGRQVGQQLDVVAGHHEHVAVEHGADVEEPERHVVVEDDVRRRSPARIEQKVQAEAIPAG